MRLPYLIFAALSLALFSGCASSPLPPRLTSAESERLSELPLPFTVGVIAYKYPVYSEKLTATLKEAGIFTRVAPLSEFSVAPDLVVQVEETIYGTAVIPAATFVTAGIIPTVVKENHGFRFSIASSSRRDRKTMIDAAYNGTSTLGLAALAVNASPDFTYSDPEQSERYRQMIAYRTIVALRPKKYAAR